MKKLLFILALTFPIFVIGQTTTENFVKTISYKTPNTVAATLAEVPANKIEQVTYYDGLGRSLQTVSAKAGGAKQNIVTYIEYDEFGRIAKSYLPFASINELPTNSYLSYITNSQLKSDTELFYNSIKYENTANPYSETSFERSTLNRPLERGAPGVAWVVNPDSDNDHTVKFDYGYNKYEDVIRKFDVEFLAGSSLQPTLEFEGIYPEKALYQTITKDENWTPTSGKDHTTEEFKNKQGQVILKRTYNDEINHDTQYVYDDFGNLTYVIPPKAIDALYGNGNFVIDGKLVIKDNHTKPAPINNGSVTLDFSGGTLTTSLELYIGGGYGPALNTGSIAQLPFAIPDMTIGTITGANGDYTLSITAGWFAITGEGGAISDYTGTFVNSVPGATLDATVLNDLCYQYVYDYRNRLIKKKIPQKGWEYIVYDKLDRSVLTQDARLRENNQWLFTKYDGLNRVVYTGLTTPASCQTAICSQSEIQALVDAQTSLNESKSTSSASFGGTAVYYSNSVYPSSNIEVLTINYYDNYTFDWNYNSGLSVSPTSALVHSPANQQALATNVNGLKTGSKIKVLDTNDWIISYTSYDAKGRPIYAASHNKFLDTTDKIQSVLDFVGNVQQTVSTHSKGGSTVTTTDYFTYDHQNRLKKHTQSINGQAQELIAENHYDELGQLEQKEVGGAASAPTALQTVDYTYNIRGWLKGINDIAATTGDDLFNFRINYTEVDTQANSNAVALYNGNIAETLWRTPNADESTVKGYNYSYDALNRLKDAVFYEPSPAGNLTGDLRYEERITGYDKNGNIVGLFRTGATTAQGFVKVWDNLSYTYAGNQLKQVAENPQTVAVQDYTQTLEEGFVDGNTTGDDYVYDVNGNMVSDANKGITSISYNHLNLPTQININTVTDNSSTNSNGAVVFEDDFSDGTVAPWAPYPTMPAPSIQSGALRMVLIRGVDFPGAYIQESLESGHQHTITFDISNMPAGFQAKLDVRRTINTPEHSYVISSNGTHSFTFITNGGGDHYINFQTNNQGDGEYPADYYYVHLDDFVLNDDDDTSGNGGNTTVGEEGIISYFYDASGMKLKKVVETATDGVMNVTSTKEYAGGYIYEDQALAMISQPEGYVEPAAGSSFKYAYNYTDHLGNVRVTYGDSNNNGIVDASEIIEENHYYPFGLKHKGYNNLVQNSNSTASKFKYNGKELNDDLGLNMYDYGARFYEPNTGRWFTPDALAEKYYDQSIYTYALNNPVIFIDPDGNAVEMCCKELKQKFFQILAGTAEGQKRFVNSTKQGVKGLIATAANNSVDLAGGDFANIGNRALDMGKASIEGVYQTITQPVKATSEILNGNIVEGVAQLTESIDGAIVGVLTEGASRSLSVASQGAKALNVVDDVAKVTDDWQGPANYSDIVDHPSVGPGKNFTSTQKTKFTNRNLEHNNGTLRSDLDGTPVDPAVQSKKGVPANMNQGEWDHVNAKSKGGSNSSSNAQLLSKKQNLDKRDN